MEKQDKQEKTVPTISLVIQSIFTTSILSMTMCLPLLKNDFNKLIIDPCFRNIFASITDIVFCFLYFGIIFLTILISSVIIPTAIEENFRFTKKTICLLSILAALVLGVVSGISILKHLGVIL